MVADNAKERRVQHLAGIDVAVEKARCVAHDVAAVGCKHFIALLAEALQSLLGVGHDLLGELVDVGFRCHLHVGVHHKGVF